MIENTYIGAVNTALYRDQTNKFSGIQKEYRSIKDYTDSCQKRIMKIEKLQNDYYESKNKKTNGPTFRSLFDVIPMFRRVDRVPDKIKKDDNVAATGLIALAALNFPEDCRDTRDAYNQVKTLMKGDKFVPSYNYKDMQHPFSFFRGTLLHNFFDSETSPFPRFAKWVVDKDITLYNTKVGRFVDRIFNIDTENIETTKKNLSGGFIQANKFNTKSLIGDLTARALSRTTAIGSAVLVGIEAAHFKKEIDLGKDKKKELVESLITYTGNLVGIGYGGAIGAKYFGPIGSIVGMGIGAVTANTVSNHFDT